MKKDNEEIRIFPGMSEEERDKQLQILGKLGIEIKAAIFSKKIKLLISLHMLKRIQQLRESGDYEGAQILLKTVVPSEVEFGQRSEGWNIDGMGTGYHKKEFVLAGFPLPANIRRLYPDRIILIPTFECPVLCRYCFRRAEAGNEKPVDMRPSLKYIRAWNENKDVKIRDIILSGGDPLSLSDEDLNNLLIELKSIPGVEILRIDTKYPAVRPERITKKLLDILDGRVNIMTLHFVHPLEICTEVIDMCKKMSRRGIILRSYTPLLKGINDDRDVLKELFWNLLSECGIIPYYAVQFIETPGAQHFRVPLGQAMDIMRSLHNELSGQAIPNLIVYLPDGGGKYIIGPNEKINVADAGIRRVAGGYKISSPLYPDKCSFYPD